MEEYQDNGEVFAGRRLLDLLRYWEIENVLLVASCFDNDSGFTLRASSSERSRHILSRYGVCSSTRTYQSLTCNFVLSVLRLC